MTQPAPFAEIWRGAFLESVHSGHAVVCDDSGQIVHAWGNPDAVILPRSSAKMIQALPLIRSGAADAMGLGTQHLALACASHQAADLHTGIIGKWLDTMGLSDGDFRCGAAVPGDIDARDALIRAYEQPCQIHHECSGKHAGFLTVNKHLGGGADYEKPDHPVQQACLEAFEEVTGLSTFGYGIDGCSVPNFSTTLHGMARAMARFAAAPNGLSRSPPASGNAPASRTSGRRNPFLHGPDACDGWKGRDQNRGRRVLHRNPARPKTWRRTQSILWHPARRRLRHRVYFGETRGA